MIFQFTWN